MISSIPSPLAQSSASAERRNGRTPIAVALLFFAFLALLTVLLGCEEDNPVEPRDSFKLTITVRDATGNPIEGVDIRRANHLDACVLESAADGEPTDLSLDETEHDPLGQIDPGQQYEYSVGPIYPSPFNPATTVRFTLKDSCYVTMDMLDWRGNLVQRLIDGKFDHKGRYEDVWTAQDDYGTHVIDGVYTCRLIARDIDTGAKVFDGTANCTVYISLDLEQCQVLGQTNASGVFTTTDRDLFPCIQGHDPRVCTNPMADTTGYCSFVDSVSIHMSMTVQDPVPHEVKTSRKIKLINGENSYTFTWEP